MFNIITAAGSHSGITLLVKTKHVCTVLLHTHLYTVDFTATEVKTTHREHNETVMQFFKNNM